jgi:chemotaxis protein CheD
MQVMCGHEGSVSNNTVSVGVGELVVSSDPSCVLIARALGSCIALLAYDPVQRAGGMLHYLLPSAAVSRPDIAQRPALFADTGIPLLLDKLAPDPKHRHNLVLRVAGGSSPHSTDAFGIGRRNYFAMRAILRRCGLNISSEAVGGTVSRTVRLVIGSGRMLLRSSDMAREIDL